MARAIVLSLWFVAGLSLSGCDTYSGAAAIAQTRPTYGLTAYSQIAFNRDGTLLAGFDAFGGKIDVYQTTNLSRITSRKIKKNQPNSLIFSPDGKYLVFDSVNRKMIEIWELDSGETATVLSLDKQRIMACLFSPDAKMFSVLCNDGAILRWDSHNWTQMPDRPSPSFWRKISASEYTHPIFSDDTNRLLIQGKEGLWLWNMQDDSVCPVSNPFDRNFHPIASRDFKLIAGTWLKGLGLTVGAWDFSTGQPIPLADAEFGLLKYIFFADFDHVSSFAFSPDGQLLAATLASSGPMRRAPESRIWRLDTGAIVWTLPSYEPEWFNTPLAFSPDGKILAVGGGSIRLFRVEDIVQNPP